MTTQCPMCQSTAIKSRNYGKKVMAITGGYAGAMNGISSATRGAKFGTSLGLVAGPTGGAMGTLVGALAGGLTGYLTGARLGVVVDQTLLNNYACGRCGHTFKDEVPYEGATIEGSDSQTTQSNLSTSLYK